MVDEIFGAPKGESNPCFRHERGITAHFRNSDEELLNTPDMRLGSALAYAGDPAGGIARDAMNAA
jgi:hypothetical protein